MNTTLLSKKGVRRAGKVLVSSELSLEAKQEAEVIINQWREIHRQPLQKIFDDIQPLLERMPNAVVAGRIKKLSTIIDKLQRPKTPDKLDTMYDIAGCRIVVPSLRELDCLCEDLSCLKAFNAERSAARDYIKCPHRDGYRCRHLIFSYKGPWGPFKLSVELQVRTELQHAWATAVEMYDRAAKTRLKFGEPVPVFSDCFSFMSDVIARIEEAEKKGQKIAFDECVQTGVPPGMFDVQATLKAACDANFLLIGKEADVSGFCLIEFDYELQTAEVKPVLGERAVAAYLEAERAAGETVDVLLLWCSSLEKMKKLYPNYFGDISMFVNIFTALEQVADEGSSGGRAWLSVQDDDLAYGLL